MFTKNKSTPKKRGRPPGRTVQGEDARRRLFETAVQLIAERGYEATTLREVAARADVSVGLLYRYFPSKRAVVLALYEELSAEYVQRGADMPSGKWRVRAVFALERSLDVLRPHREALMALAPALVSRGDEGVFARGTAVSRLRVQQVFQDAVTGASDAPARLLADATGRLLYLVHLAVILWWLMDRSPRQRATRALVDLLARVLPSAALALRLPSIGGFVRALDELVRDALVEEAS